MDNEDYSINNATEMTDLEGDSFGGSAFSDSPNKGTTGSHEVYPDPVADKLLNYYRGFGLDKNESLRYGIMAAPLSAIVVFYVLISSSTSSIISFSAFVFSIIFLLVSMWMLCDILLRDIGPRGM